MALLNLFYDPIKHEKKKKNPYILFDSTLPSKRRQYRTIQVWSGYNDIFVVYSCALPMYSAVCLYKDNGVVGL